MSLIGTYVSRSAAGTTTLVIDSEQGSDFNGTITTEHDGTNYVLTVSGYHYARAGAAILTFYAHTIEQNLLLYQAWTGSGEDPSYPALRLRGYASVVTSMHDYCVKLVYGKFLRSSTVTPSGE